MSSRELHIGQNKTFYSYGPNTQSCAEALCFTLHVQYALMKLEDWFNVRNRRAALIWSLHFDVPGLWVQLYRWGTTAWDLAGTFGRTLAVCSCTGVSLHQIDNPVSYYIYIYNTNNKVQKYIHILAHRIVEFRGQWSDDKNYEFRTLCNRSEQKSVSKPEADWLQEQKTTSCSSRVSKEQEPEAVIFDAFWFSHHFVYNFTACCE